MANTSDAELRCFQGCELQLSSKSRSFVDSPRSLQQAGFVICQPLANAVYREAEKEIYPVCKVSQPDS